MKDAFIVAINGKIGAGKSTFMGILKQKLEEKGYCVKTRNFADRLKKFCEDMTGYGGYTQEEKNIYLEEWGMTVGEWLQDAGTKALRNNFEQNIWVIATLRNLHKNTVYLLGDCRYRNEADSVRKKGGIVLRLDGDPANVREQSKRDLQHSSEVDLDDYENFAARFVNDGPIEKLEEFADKIVKNFVENIY